jgi:hypothetical protein
MDPSEANRIAILLEIISYFFVTLDLYGQDRLVRTEERFRQIFERIRRRDLIARAIDVVATPIISVFQMAGRFILQGEQWSGCAGEVGGWIGVLAMMVGVGIAYQIFPSLRDLGFLGFGLAVFCAMLIVPFGLAFIILLMYIVFLLIFLLLQGILVVAHTLLIRWHLSGILVFVGTVLFLIGRILLLVYF